MRSRLSARVRSLLSVGVAAAAALVPAAASANVQPGDQLDFNLKLMDGSTVGVADLTDKVTVVEFWATWCPPCVKQIPHLKKVHQDFSPRGVKLISVSRDRDPAVAQGFIKKHEMNWTQAHDGSQADPFGPAWGVKGIPHAFIVAPGGELLWRGHPANMDGPLEQAVTRFEDRLTPESLSLKMANRELVRGRKALQKDADNLDKVVQLILMIPPAHYANKTLRASANKLYAVMQKVDPDGRRTAELVEDRAANEAHRARVDAFHAAQQETAADAGDGEPQRPAA